MTSLLKCPFSFSSLRTVALVLVLLFSHVLPAQDSTPRLSSDTETATAGFFRLSWESFDINSVFELQQANNPAFLDATIRYRGPDKASVISGLPDGDWYYRLRAINDREASVWSDAIMVEVAHHPLSRALLFFGLGVLVFVSTVFLVIRGAKEAG